MLTKEDILKGSKTSFKDAGNSLEKEVTARELQDGTIEITLRYVKKCLYTGFDSIRLEDTIYLKELNPKLISIIYGSVIGFNEKVYANALSLLED